MKFKKCLFLFLISFFLIPVTYLQAANGFDHSAFNSLLKQYVNEKGEVNYRAIKENPSLLNDYLSQMPAVNEKVVLKKWPREEAIALWLNVYHATLIKLIVENYPVTSVQKIPSFWDITAFQIGNEREESFHSYSLNDIRTKKLMKIYRNEKFHLVLSLAAQGGPKLKNEAFTGPTVEGQIFKSTREWVNNPVYVDIVPGHKKIKISKIFKWYANDFKLNFGTSEPIGKFSASESAVLSFLAYYLEDESKIEYLQNGKYKIEYPPLDWTLNDWKSSETLVPPVSQKP